MADRPSPSTLISRGLLALGVLGFTIAHTVMGRWKAMGLQSEWGFDVTFFHNLVWNTANGNGYRQSGTYHEPPGIFGETHFEPILLLAALPYKIAPHLETILALQSLLMALGAVGIYRLVRPASPMACAAAAWIYLLWWPIQRMAMADIRPLMWAVPFLILLAAALKEERHWEAFTWGLLACLCREEVPALVLFLCAGSWLAGRARGTAVRLTLATVLFVVLSTSLRSNASFYIQPGRWIEALLGTGDGGGGDGGWGHSAGDLLGVRIDYMRQWMLPVGLGSLLGPEILVGAVPLLGYLFTQPHEWATWEGPYVHHAAPAAAIVAAAAALGWARLLRKVPAPAVAAVLVGLLAFEGWELQRRWEPTLAPELTPWLEPEPRVVEAHRLADQVPPEASVMADWHTVHLFSGRAQVYSYHQESPELDQLEPPVQGALLPRPEVTPDWALVHREDAVWLRRCRSLGFVDVDAGEEWTLLRAPGAG